MAFRSSTAMMRPKRVEAPDKLECNHCGVNKPTEQFSPKQFDKYFAALSLNPNSRTRAQVYITCKACTPGNVHSLYCQDCNKWLHKDLFSKTMRRTPDDAICWNCHQAQQNVPPARDGGSDDEGDNTNFAPPGMGDDEDDDDDHGGATISGTSTFGGLGGLSLAPSESANGYGSSYYTHEGGVPLHDGGNSHKTSLTSPKWKSTSSASSSSSSIAISTPESSTKAVKKFVKTPTNFSDLIKSTHSFGIGSIYQPKSSIDNVQVRCEPEAEPGLAPESDSEESSDDDTDVEGSSV